LKYAKGRHENDSAVDFRVHPNAAPLKYAAVSAWKKQEGIFPRSSERGPIEVRWLLIIALAVRTFPRSSERGPIEVRRATKDV